MVEHEHHEPEPEASSPTDDFATVLAEVDRGSGTQVLRSDDADELALRLAEATGATLIDDLDELGELADDTSTDGGGASDGPSGSSVVCDIGELTELAGRVLAARDLVAAAVASTADRAYPSTGVALHPDSIRSAAAEVLDARADALEAERAAGVDADDAEDHDDAVDPAMDPDAHPEEGQTFDRFWGGDDSAPTTDDGRSDDGDEEDDDEDDAWSLGRPVILLVIWLLLGVAVFVAGGGPIALALPAIALVWIGLLLWRRRRADARSAESAEAEAELDVSANLASVLAATDQAYGGEGGRFDDPERGATARALAAARQRLKVAENRWRALMGPNADVHDVEAEIARRDPQHGSVPAAVVDESPSVRAARHHLRRLEGRWKVSWWAMDRPVPPVDEADGSVALLRSEGRTEVVFVSGESRPVTTVVYRSGGDVDEQALPSVDGVRLVVVMGAADAADQVS